MPFIVQRMTRDDDNVLWTSKVKEKKFESFHDKEVITTETDKYLT